MRDLFIFQSGFAVEQGGPASFACSEKISGMTIAQVENLTGVFPVAFSTFRKISISGFSHPISLEIKYDQKLCRSADRRARCAGGSRYWKELRVYSLVRQECLKFPMHLRLVSSNLPGQRGSQVFEQGFDVFIFGKGRKVSVTTSLQNSFSSPPLVFYRSATCQRIDRNAGRLPRLLPRSHIPGRFFHKQPRRRAKGVQECRQHPQ